MERFESECFAAWLNVIDARIGYDLRRQSGLASWRKLFDEGYAENEAAAICAY
jgi:hypothetical protein